MSNRTGPPPTSRSAGYGPRGYLPERAAKRARKIILREPLGLGWVLAAVVAAAVLAVAGLAYLIAASGPPGRPFVAVGPLDAVDARGSALLNAGSARVLVVRGGGGVATFEAPGGQARWCPASARIESTRGDVWRLDGQRIGGEAGSLTPLRSRVHDGVLYVDPATPLATVRPAPGDQPPTCNR